MICIGSWKTQQRLSSAAAATAAKSLQLCPTLCDPRDGSPPGSPVPGILQARTLEWVAISFSNAWKWKVKVKTLSCVRLLATPWTAAHQAPPSMGFSRQEYWSGVPLPSPSALLPTPNCSVMFTSRDTYWKWTSERPVFLPTYRAQNQHMWVKCLSLWTYAIRSRHEARSTLVEPWVSKWGPRSAISASPGNLLGNLDSQPRLLPSYQSLLWGWHLATGVLTRPPGNSDAGSLQ